MQQLKDLIDQLGDDPYKILESQPNSDLQSLRKNYRQLAIKYHPDKNPSEQAKLKFLKINQAYEYLQQDPNRQTYQSYIKVLQEQKKRSEGMDEKRRKLAEELARREEDRSRVKQDIERELAKRKMFFKKKMEEEEERSRVREEVMGSIGVQQYYHLISSFDIHWQEGLSFTQNMLQTGFKNYGKITSIKLQPKRNKATLSMDSIQDCTRVVKQFKHPLISISFHLDEKKREHLLKALHTQKTQKLDFSLSSDNIERFKEIVNRGSGLYRPDYRVDI